MTAAPTDHLVLPTTIEGVWQTAKKAETITVGEYTATLTPANTDGKGAKRIYTITRRGLQVDNGFFVRTPRNAMNKLLHQLHFAALPTQLLSDWSAALKAVLRERQEARWTDTYGQTWRRWQAVLGSLDHRAPAGKILDLTITDIDGQRTLEITVRTGYNAATLSERKWIVTGWAPLTDDNHFPGHLADIAVNRVQVKTTGSDGTGDYAYTLDTGNDWGDMLARALTRNAAQLLLHRAAAVDTNSPNT